MDLSLPAVLGGGIVAAAAFVTGMVEVLKRLIPIIGKHQWEPQLAAVLGGALVIAAFSQVPTPDLAAAFGAVLSWYGITRLALGIHDDATQQPGSLTGAPQAGTDPPGTGGNP